MSTQPSSSPPPGGGRPDPADPALEVHVARQPGRVVARIAGEIDLAAEAVLPDRLSAAVDGQPDPEVVVDLGGVGFIDGRGLRCLLGIDDLLGQQGVRLTWVNPSTPVRRLAELVGAPCLLADGGATDGHQAGGRPGTDDQAPGSRNGSRLRSAAGNPGDGPAELPV